MTNKLIGQNYTTPDLVAKVTGQAKYAEDYRVDGMLFCKLLLSPYPHARIKRIDTSRALATPGRQGRAHRRRTAGAGRRRFGSRTAVRREHQGREGADQRAGLSGRTRARSRRDRRAHRERRAREDRDRVGAAPVCGRSAREPEARRSKRAARGQHLGTSEAARAGSASRSSRHRGAEVDGRRLCRVRPGTAADGQDARRMDLR